MQAQSEALVVKIVRKKVKKFSLYCIYLVFTKYYLVCSTMMVVVLLLFVDGSAKIYCPYITKSDMRTSLAPKIFQHEIN